MRTPRDRFLNQWTSTILVRGIQSWSLRLIGPPEHLPGSLYDAMTISNGTFSVTRNEFYAAIWPLVVETHEKGRKAKGSDALTMVETGLPLLSNCSAQY